MDISTYLANAYLYTNGRANDDSVLLHLLESRLGAGSTVFQSSISGHSLDRVRIMIILPDESYQLTAHCRRSVV